jgi:phosphoribosylaminoimidazole-succinocarboxamide synthase
MIRERIEADLGCAFQGLPEKIARGRPIRRGKVRDIVEGDSVELVVASDRISAYDRVVSSVPFKGEVLSRTAAFWFRNSGDIVSNYVIAGPGELEGSGRACLARRAEKLPFLVVVRGYLAGSAWRRYSANLTLSGIRLPEGLSLNEKFPVPLITPSIRGEGDREKSVSKEELIAKKLVDQELWREIEKVSIGLFRRGQELIAPSGLILVDSCYEFGLIGGELSLCDDIHTPDTSRFWWGQSYQSLYDAGESQKELDKEPLRRWLADRAFRGDGEPPLIPDSLRIDTVWRYIQAYESITGEFFEPLAPSPQAEMAALERIIAEKLR